jgi:hypothetical protein
MKYTLTKEAIQWIISKIKNSSSDISSLEEMCLQNHFELPINISSDSDVVLFTDDSGNAILAEWSYQIK